MKKRTEYKHPKALELFDIYQAAKDERIVKNQEEFAEKIGIGRTSFHKLLNENPDEISEDLLTKAKEISQRTNNVPRIPFHEQRRDRKNGHSEDEGLIYVPITAQAGYSQRVKEPSFEQDFERVYLPGLKFKGAKYRIFEVNGDSMEPTLKEGVQVIAELVESESWKSVANHYIYVIVSDDMISIKRVFRKNDKQWVLISDNDEFYDQFLFEVKNLKELWKVKRKLEWDMPPPKKFEIKV